MKVVAFNGSARRDGNTAMLVERVFAELEAAGIETELVQLAGARRYVGCTDCGTLRANATTVAARSDDDGFVNECIAKMVAADGIIIGSPVYFANCTAVTQALIERAGYATRKSGHPAGAQGRRGGRRRAPRRRHARLRLDQPLLPDQPDDRRRLELLEYRHRPRRRRRGRPTTRVCRRCRPWVENMAWLLRAWRRAARAARLARRAAPLRHCVRRRRGRLRRAPPQPRSHSPCAARCPRGQGFFARSRSHRRGGRAHACGARADVRE